MFLVMENPSERGGINRGIWGPSSANKGIVSWGGCLGFSLPLGAAGEEADTGLPALAKSTGGIGMSSSRAVNELTA